MKTFTLLMIGIGLSFLASCTSQRKILNSYMGATKQQVIMGFGPPNEVASDGNGGEILLYYRSAYIPGQAGLVTVGANNQLYQGHGTPGYSISRRTAIYINSKGLVYYWRIN